MNIAVCVKIVPESESLVFDQEAGVVRRSAASSCVSPADLVAIEAALRLKKEYGGSVHGISMGPESALGVLRTAYYLGLDHIALLCSRAFAGADVAATAYTLSGYFAANPAFDLILCGKHSSDGGTGQLGAFLAERLNLPHLGSVCRIEGIRGGTLTAEQRMDGKILYSELTLPGLLVVETDLAHPHTPTLSDTLKARNKAIEVLQEGDIPGLDVSRCGSAGSFTKLIRVFVPQKEREVELFSGNELDRLVGAIVE
ncbi:MAG: electron transfer flavoprotein subunit beta/FixA family protein [Bacillota bacterium]